MKLLEIGGYHVNLDMVTHLSAATDRGGNDATNIHFIGGHYVTVGGTPKRVRSLMRPLGVGID
jgi:hypothetical protein